MNTINLRAGRGVKVNSEITMEYNARIECYILKQGNNTVQMDNSEIDKLVDFVIANEELQNMMEKKENEQRAN